MGDSVTEDGSARAVDDDADAAWRPGFDGWTDFAAVANEPVVPARRVDEPDERWSREHDLAEPEPWVPQRPERTVRRAPPEPVGRPVADVPGKPPSSVFGSVVLAAIGVAAAVVAAGFVAVSLRPAEPAPVETVRAPVVPEAVRALWTTEIGGSIDATAVGPTSVVVHSRDAGVLLSFDRTTGAELWSAPSIDSDRGVDVLAVIDDVVAMQWRGPTGTSHVDAVDAQTGEHLWSSSLDAAVMSVATTPEGAVILRRDRVDDRGMLARLDPRSGEPLADPVVVGGVAVPGAAIGAVPVDGRTVAWSLLTLEPTTPAVDSFNVRSIAPLGDLVVGLDLEGRILAFDADGERTDEQRFVSDAFGEFTSRAGLAGVVEDAGVGLISSGSSMGFKIVDGRIEPIWQRVGRAFTPVETEIGAVSLLLGPTGDAGEIDESVIDPATGETLAVTDEGVTREQSPLLGHNGYLVMPEIGDPDRRLSAFDYMGELLWELPISSTARFEMQSGLILLMERGIEMSTLSAVG